MKTLLKKFPAVSLVIGILFVLATAGVFAAWIMKGQILGMSIGAKSKFLMLSNNGGTTWSKTLPSMFNGTLNPGGDTANLISFQSKSSKYLVSIKWTFENIKWYIDGVEMTTPPTGAVGDEDIRDFLLVSRDGGITWIPFKTFDTSTEAWVDTDSDKVYDNSLEIRIKLASNVEDYQALNSQTIGFDLGLEGI